MNCETLRKRLEEAGCSESHYSIRTWEDDTFCLDFIDGEWQVFYTERGQWSEPEFRSESEEEACAYLWEKMQRVRHEHLVGTFADLAEARELCQALERLDLPHHLDSIPEPVVRPTLYRVFVHGKAIFEARRCFPELPIRRWVSIG